MTKRKEGDVKRQERLRGYGGDGKYEQYTGKINDCVIQSWKRGSGREKRRRAEGIEERDGGLEDAEKKKITVMNKIGGVGIKE